MEGPRKDRMTAPNTPPTKDEMIAALRAVLDCPFCAIGYPSREVATAEGAPGIFRRIAEHENFSVKGFCEWAKEKNLLRHNDKNQNKVRTGATTSRFYTIKLPPEEETEEEQFHDAADQELPFD